METIKQVGEKRNELAQKYGLNLEKNIKFIVTDEGKPMVVTFDVSDPSKQKKIMLQNGIRPAVMYGTWFEGITTGFQTWNGHNNGVFEKYLADARINRTPEQCVEAIIQGSNGEVTHLGML